LPGAAVRRTAPERPNLRTAPNGRTSHNGRSALSDEAPDIGPGTRPVAQEGHWGAITGVRPNRDFGAAAPSARATNFAVISVFRGEE